MTRDEAIMRLEILKDFSQNNELKNMHEAIDMAIEALERKHGEWSLNIDDWFGDCYKCSACGEEFILNEGTPKDNGYNYCPNCGARMDERREE